MLNEPLTWEKVAALLRSLPPDPIRPENRNKALLRPSEWAQRGTIYHVGPVYLGGGPEQHLVVMHKDDADDLRALWAKSPCASLLNIDQEIADCCVQMIADRQKR